MSTSEVIYLSSEDEADDNVQNKISNETNEVLPAKNYNTNNVEVNKKRISPVFIHAPITKRINSNALVEKDDKAIERSESIEIVEVIARKSPLNSSSLSINSEKEKGKVAKTENEEANLVDKPLLVIKEKHPVHASCGRHDIFSMFLSQCLQRDKSADMRKIVEKLKRKYEQLDPTYADSEEFENLLNEKRNCLMPENSQVYKHIAEINGEMKLRKRGKNTESTLNCSTSNKNEKNNTCEEKEEEYCEVTRKRDNKIRAIERAMRIVKKRIQKYDEAEVDLDDETASNYLICERYKKRMVELHSKWCELTGNHKDAGRTYLRPIHLKLTGIVIVDQAINRFINNKLKRGKNRRNSSYISNNLLFPDYNDIFNIIHEHNVNQNLGMNTRAERFTAKQAFIKLGEYLKCERQKDFYDTFSSIYEQTDDPASKNSELMTKLHENHALAEKNMNAIFDEFSKRQDEVNLSDVDNESSICTDNVINGEDEKKLENCANNFHQ